MNIQTLLLTVLFTLGLVACGPVSSKPTAASTAALVSKEYKTYEPVKVSVIGNYDAYTRFRQEAYGRKTDRQSYAYQVKSSKLVEILDKALAKQVEPLGVLKDKDPSAAFYWLEEKLHLRSSFDAPTSEAYKEFTKALKAISDEQTAEVKTVDQAYDKATDHIDAVYSEETDHLEKLWQQSH